MSDAPARIRRLCFLQLKRGQQMLQRRSEGNNARQVTFVSGVQRSGTNLLMDILERSWKTDVFMENDPRAFDNYIMRDVPVIRRLVEGSPSRRVVIKALCEAHDLTRLMEIFAPAKAIWMFRHYDDMINSNMAAWPGGRNQLEDVIRDRNSAGWRGRGMTDETHAIIREHYRPHMNDASALGLFWYYRNQLFFDQGFDRSDLVMLMAYEALARTPAPNIDNLARFIDIEPTGAMYALVSPKSIRKKSPPPIDDRVRVLCDSMLARLTAVWQARWEKGR